MPVSYSAYHNLWQQLCNMMVLICTEKTTLTLLPLANPSRTTTFRKICVKVTKVESITHTDTFNGPFPGLPRWAGTRKVKPIWILLKQETASGSGISWATCKSAPCSRQITTPAPHHSVFYRPDALPVAQPTALKQKVLITKKQLQRDWKTLIHSVFLQAGCPSCRPTNSVKALKA